MFMFGQQSEANFEGVDPRLPRCARRALSLSTVDFSCFEGLRTLSRQRELVRSGASRTMASKHLEGRAIDLVPYVHGRLQWQQPLCNQVAIAMREASIYFSVPLRWGSVWDRELHDLDPARIEQEISAYIERYRAERLRLYGKDDKKLPLIDGPHFELVD